MLFEVLDHTVKHEGRVINVFVDKIRYPDGHIENREIVEHGGGSVVLGLQADGKIIFVKQHRYPINKIIYELPAGKLDKNEDPLDCAKREFEEETGNKASTWLKLLSIYTSPGYTSEELFVFLAKDLFDGTRNLEPGEKHMKLEYLEPETALEKIYCGEIKDGKTITALLFYKSFLDRFKERI
jgi:ADP-ribose pyrophosphatase